MPANSVPVPNGSTTRERLEASLAAQRAFDVYRGDKMSHTPVTFMRVAPGQPWRRIDGFVTADELIHEYHQLLAVK